VHFYQLTFQVSVTEFVGFNYPICTNHLQIGYAPKTFAVA